MGGLNPGRIGVLGGTFDPVHIGHLVIALEALHQLDLERVLFVPAGDPPHKPTWPLSDAEHRYRMLARALAREPRMTPARFDLDRPGPHYTVDLLAAVRAVHPGARLHFIMGADSLRDFPTWRRPADIVQLCRLAVAGRPGVELDLSALARAVTGAENAVDVLHAPWMSISGTDIRRRVAAGLPIHFQVPEAVEAYIFRHGLYRR